MKFNPVLTPTADSHLPEPINSAGLAPEVPVTQPFLPPLEEFQESLKEIWESKWLTNKGQFHRRLEAALAEYLEVEHISLFTNGTLALLTALQALRITGEVITTPFSFVATTHALHWNGITPVFADIDPETYNLDPDRIEKLITPRTSAILPVHVFGNPCAVDKIQWYADIYGLKVIYDAAHAFAVRVDNRSILDFGDLAVMSFHATKVFTTFEGGAIVSRDAATKKRIDYLKNFGFANETTVVGPGINGKMNEVQAAMGMLQLRYVDQAIEQRRIRAELYRKLLGDVAGIRLSGDIQGVRHNYPYFPILIDQDVFGASREDVYLALRANRIWGRRYFYPLISQFPTYKGLPSASPENLPVAECITEQILCLPLYPDLPLDTVRDITRIVVAAGEERSICG